MIQITSEPIDLAQVVACVRDNRCGATVLFSGSTRAVTDGQSTQTLHYECYESMARRALAELETVATRRWPIHQCCIVHRVGMVEVGETSVAIAVSSPHRADAFAAAQWLIDSVKNQVPIWKKEVFTDGSEQWQHPVSPT